ncbi:hypothetical protein [Actinopolyspora sp. H202]|uniref:hypothetical protein n=1 Tax=Actinopolyspora sp. H202 TaxID=1500456 RepID=UPI003F4A1019
MYRLSSPTWASLAYQFDSPKRAALAEHFDEIREYETNRLPESADSANYYCGFHYLDSERCDAWFVWLRYGQYVVSLTADPPENRPDFETDRNEVEIPDWLYRVTAHVDRAFMEAVPK